MIRHLLMVIGVLVVVPIAALGDDVQKLIEQWRWEPPQSAELAAVSQEKRPAIIAALRKWADDTNELVRRESARRFLIELGDMETATKVVQEFLREDGPDSPKRHAEYVLGGVTQPWIIPMLASGLFRNERLRMRYWTSEDEYPPVSVRSSFGMIGIANRCPALASQVRESFHWQKVLLDAETLRQSMRAWWIENNEAFARKDYAAVKPFRRVEEVITSSNAPPAVATNVLPPTATTTQAAPKAVAPPPVTPSPTEARTKDWTTLRTVALLVSALGLIGFLVWRVRRR